MTINIINAKETWDPRATDLIGVTNECPYCKGNTVIKVSSFLYVKWASGQANIQDVWPHVSPDQREAMITGYHSQCFDDMFKGIDDE